MPTLFSALVGATSLCALATAATAGTGTADAGGTAEKVAALAPEIVVTGQREEYGARSTRTGTKTDTEVRNIPQAMSIVSESQIEDQQLRSVGDLLLFVPGAAAGTGEGNRDQITLRGNNSTADFFVNGVRDDVQYFRDFYNVDRVEVLKGPNAMIFGRGGGGGVVNRVTKRASLGQARELLLSADSEGGYRVSADLDQPLGANVGARIAGVYEKGESFRRHVGLERYGINPTVGILAGPDTRIDLSYEYFHDDRTTDRGVPSWNGRPVEGFRSDFFGNPDLSFAEADVHLAQVALEHELSPGLSLRNRTLFGDYDKFYQNVFPSRLVSATEVQLGAYNAATARRNLFTQTDLVWNGALGGIDQTLLAGFELGRQRSRNTRMTGTVVGGNRVPLADPTTDREVLFAPSATDANNRTRATVAALYIQDQLRPTDWLEIVAGLRFDRFRLEVDDLRSAGGAFERSDSLVSPRLGLVVKPRPDLSLYASYARSYLPQSGDQFSGLDITTSALEPERFDNLEVGAKWELAEGLLATAALYQLTRSNTRAADPLDPTRTVLTGEQRSRGLELGLERSIGKRWQVSAGYAFQKARVTEATAACPSGDCEAPLVPRHSFSLWNKYQLSKPLALGFGVVARSKVYTSIGNAVELPGFVRFDAAAYYRLARGIEAQVNVENLFDRDYFASAHSDNNIAPGAPRTVKASLRFGF